MRQPTTGMLEVPGADIFYEVRGSGPALLLISTGNGDAAPFGPLADRLAERHTVVSYDRRGFSRSPLTAPLDNDRRLDDDADDALRLLEHVAAGPGHVFGTCSGAVVALRLAELHADRIGMLVAHEPPSVSVLPDAAHWLAFHRSLYDTYRTVGMTAARDAFRDYAGLGDTRPPPGAELPPAQLAELLARLKDNQIFWFENELLTYPAYVPDSDVLKALGDRVVLAGGATSREHFSCRPTAVLAERTGTGVTIFPGSHVGHVTHPYEYADTLLRVLEGPRGS
ncbi:alpha/beta hydrolase [Winogradskya consettensis]|uniref:Alpha/beta hydrolase n=1 Tax=Winogradskya consettensis TaxID=113560 RepID=A0A919T584_9ACTN|nr:alpha/beta hydrolase [Actinoplanes consettensis]GIM85404.1 alpha/beta hydrolase [Actinoplanes consettensis]